MSKLPGIIGGVIFALLLAVLASSLALAADAKPMAFGSVDVEKAFNGCEKKVQLQQELEVQVAQVQKWLELRSSNKLLTPEEFKQLVDLRAKPNPEQADTKKMEELLALSKQRDEAFQALQQKSVLTDAERTQLNEIQDRVKKVEASMQEELKKKDGELTGKRIELSKQVMQDVEAAVAAVAKEKGLAMVFAKSIGDYTLVIYSNVDITDDVLKKLNKK
ncbi:MAG TPA: OmpH family outer membrane protein [Armatimonadota bacterium]|nr:OmpH family outer membrane protein [Armatimonadota bacterium]